MTHSSNDTPHQFTLMIQRPGGSNLERPLEPGRSVFLGKSATCGIQIECDGVAEIHCLFDFDGENVSVQDWASDTGTQVNGNPIDEKVGLQANDEIKVGSATIVVVEKQPRGTSRPSVADVKEAPQEVVAHAPPQEHELAEPFDSCPEAETIGEEFLATEAHSPHQVPPPVVQDALVEDRFPTNQDADSHDVIDEMDPEGLDQIVADSWDANEQGWDLTAEDAYDAETVELLKSEIEDLRIQLVARDEQIALLTQNPDENPSDNDSRDNDSRDNNSRDSDARDVAERSDELVERMDNMLAEMSEYDERVMMLQELLETAEIQNKAEKEERQCLENWLGEIEQRFAQRESEWKAERDALRSRLDQAVKERDHVQKQLQQVAKRYNAPKAAEETLARLQQQNASLQDELDHAKRDCVQLKNELQNAENADENEYHEERAKLAKERAEISRMRFQLSKQLSEINETEIPKAENNPDREFAVRIQTLREHLREIHEEERDERAAKGESILGRISGLWKRVEDRY